METLLNSIAYLYVVFLFAQSFISIPELTWMVEKSKQLPLDHYGQIRSWRKTWICKLCSAPFCITCISCIRQTCVHVKRAFSKCLPKKYGQIRNTFKKTRYVYKWEAKYVRHWCTHLSLSFCSFKSISFIQYICSFLECLIVATWSKLALCLVLLL